MPELPEVQTIVMGLNRMVVGHKFIGLWTDWPKSFQPNLPKVKEGIKGKKIKKIRRRAKNILIDLSGDKTLLIHLKMTGHLLYRDKNWKQKVNAGHPFHDTRNQYIRTIFFLDKNKELAFSDLRRFGKVVLFDTKKESQIKDLKNLGPEPLAKDFNFRKFTLVLKDKVGKVKTVLLNQTVIAGIGNIYADEILWEAKIQPLTKVNQLTLNQKKRLFLALKKVLQKAVKSRGTSMADYRDTAGEKGRYQLDRKVYQRKDEFCYRCKNIIKKIKINNRGTYYCPRCQKN